MNSRPALLISRTSYIKHLTLLSKAERDARLEEVFKNDEFLNTSVELNWNELNNTYRATGDIIAQLDQAITHSEELHGMTIQCMTQNRSLSGLLPGNPDGVEEWSNTISLLDGLLQDSGTIMCEIHHKLLIGAITITTCLSSLLTHPHHYQMTTHRIHPYA